MPYRPESYRSQECGLALSTTMTTAGLDEGNKSDKFSKCLYFCQIFPLNLFCDLTQILQLNLFSDFTKY